MFQKIFGRDKAEDAAEKLYASAVTAARQPVLYERYGVPDTLDGRFEMIALHVYVILRRLRTGEKAARPMAQKLFDTMFVNMDRTLREMGVGDLSVGRRVKEMAQAFYGRIAAYDAALVGGGPEKIEPALARNVFRLPEDQRSEQAAALAAYLFSLAVTLESQDVNGFERGEVSFPAPAAPESADVVR
jgi:cytochrome b pre-mRNA-processing protein 3